MGKCVWHEVTKEYVEKVSDFGGEFDFTPHKARARVFSDHAAAQLAITKTIELYENRVPLVLTEVDRVVGELLRLTPAQRVEVFRQVCRECGSDDKDCICWNDE